MQQYDRLSTIEKLKALEAVFATLDESRNQRLARLGEALGQQMRPQRTWSDKALYRVLAGQPAGRFLATAIDRLFVQAVVK